VGFTPEHQEATAYTHDEQQSDWQEEPHQTRLCFQVRVAPANHKYQQGPDHDARKYDQKAGAH